MTWFIYHKDLKPLYNGNLVHAELYYCRVENKEVMLMSYPLVSIIMWRILSLQTHMVIAKFSGLYYCCGQY